MEILIALIGSLAAAAVPLALGFRHYGSVEASVARAFGLTPERRRWNPEEWARRTGTGLNFRQIAFGGAIWICGGFILGWLAAGVDVGFLLAVAGGLFYFGGLADRAAEFRMRQASRLLNATQVMITALGEGRGLEEAIELSIPAAGEARPVVEDLLHAIRQAGSAADRAEAVRRWTQQWGVILDDLIGAALISAMEKDIRPYPILVSIRKTMGDVLEILSRARAEAKGLEVQAKVLGIGPIGIVLFLMTVGGMRSFWQNPIYLIPVFAGSVLAYALTMRQIHSGLSPEASVGLLPGGGGEIPRDRFGRPIG